MNILIHLAAATPGPVPTPTSTLTNDNLVTPGWEGFSVMFLIGLVVILLVLDFVRRLRKLNYRAEIRERLEAEAAAEDAERESRPIPHTD